MTQESGSGPDNILVRRILAAVDEQQSKEIAKHTMRSMEENARQGFWNGSRPPFGYQTVVVEQRGARLKKRLAIEPIVLTNPIYKGEYFNTAFHDMIVFAAHVLLKDRDEGRSYEELDSAVFDELLRGQGHSEEECAQARNVRRNVILDI